MDGSVPMGATLVTKRFFALDTKTYEPGALDAKMKELLGLVASMVLRCDDCIAYHVIRCHELGATQEEILEILNVGLIVGGSIVIPHLRRAVELLDLIDQPIEDVSIELVKSGSVGAATLAQSATDILQARDGVTGRSPKGRVVALPDGSGVAIVAVIQIRTQDVLSEAVGAAVVDVLEEHAEALRRGALVTILNQASRVRILPVLP